MFSRRHGEQRFAKSFGEFDELKRGFGFSVATDGSRVWVGDPSEREIQVLEPWPSGSWERSRLFNCLAQLREASSPSAAISPGEAALLSRLLSVLCS